MVDRPRYVRSDLGASYGGQEPWASVEEAARHLGVSKDTIYRWIDRKRLPAHKIGRL